MKPVRSVVFERLVANCGLSSMFAEHAMARAVGRCGLAPETFDAHDLERSLPDIERAIRPFLAELETLAVIQALRQSIESSLPGRDHSHAA